MKLIDLLAQELPKRGGWPDGVSSIAQCHDGQVWYDDDGNAKKFKQVASNSRKSGHAFVVGESEVTREQYEAALAAAQQPVWNGEGLPPLGCEFEYGKHRTKAKCLGIGHQMIFASKGDPNDEEGDFEEFMLSIMHSEFHPVRSQSDKNRDAAIKKITDAICGEIPDVGMATASKYAVRAYDAIAAGEVHGVKLSD